MVGALEGGTGLDIMQMHRWKYSVNKREGAWLAQSVERETLNLWVVSSSLTHWVLRLLRNKILKKKNKNEREDQKMTPPWLSLLSNLNYEFSQGRLVGSVS